MDKKRILQSVLVFLFFGTFIILINITSPSLNYDLIWCFHISQKISNGFKLYSEIGTVVTPIYFWLGGLFIKIFGNNLISMHIYSGVIAGGIATVLFNIIRETVNKENKLANYIFGFATIMYLSQLSLTNYNSTAVLWVLIAASFEIRKEKVRIEDKEKLTSKKENIYNLLIGLFLGIAFFTKQNIGAYGVFATGIYSLIYKCFIKKENTVKEILLKASGFLAFFAVMILYFICTQTVGDFFNFCFGGLLEFGDKNLRIGFPYEYAGAIAIIVIAYGFVVDKKENSDLLALELFYLCCMMFLIYPLTNKYHALLGMIIIIPMVNLILNKITKNNIAYTIVAIIFVLFFRLAIISGGGGRTETEVLFYNMESYLRFVVTIFSGIYLIIFCLNIVWDTRKILNLISVIFAFVYVGYGIYLYRINVNTNTYLPEKLEIYAKGGYPKEVLDYINDVVEYILEKESEGYNVYVVSADASYYMAPLGRNQYKYDLNLYGSLGHNGEKILIEETQKLKNALILKDENVMFQEPIAFDEFIRNTYTPIDKVRNLIVYSTEG